jgi:hypothetical protein
LGGGDELLLGLDDGPGSPVVAAELLDLRSELDAAEQPVEVRPGEAALRSLGHGGAEGSAVSGGVLTVQKGRTLRVGEVGDHFGQRRVAVARRPHGRVRRGCICAPPGHQRAPPTARREALLSVRAPNNIGTDEVVIRIVDRLPQWSDSAERFWA